MSARATVYNPSTAQLGPLEADVARKGTQQGHLRKRGGMWHVFYRDWLAAADGSVSYGPTSASTGCTAYKAAKVKDMGAGDALHMLVEEGVAMLEPWKMLQLMDLKQGFDEPATGEDS